MRLYSGSSTSELEELAEKFWNSPDKLKNVLEELGCRGKKGTQKNRERISNLKESITNRLNQTSDRRRTSEDPSNNETEVLKRQLQDAQRRAETAEQKIKELTAELDRKRARQTHSESEELWRIVGLASNCPDFVFDAARKAYRKKHHPDTMHGRTEAEKKAAEVKFKEIDNAFDKLYGMRPR